MILLVMTQTLKKGLSCLNEAQKMKNKKKKEEKAV